MTTQKKPLLNETVLRRWGKLANMKSLTENFIDTISEEDRSEEEAHDLEKAHDEMDYAEGDEMRADEEGMDPDVDPDAVEAVVDIIVQALDSKTSASVSMESDEDGEVSDEELSLVGDDGDVEMSMDLEDEAAMRSYNRQDETLNIDVIDDEALTEAVLQRVVERLLTNQ